LLPPAVRRLAGITHQKIANRAVERYLGIDTQGVVQVTAEGAAEYSPAPYIVLLSLLDHLDPGSADVFVDVGCGKGRAVCLACRHPMRRVVGIEIDDGLARKARINLLALRGAQAAVELRHMRAEHFDYADATIVYLFNPFSRRILSTFLGRLRDTHRRSLRIVYANSVHKQLLEHCDWLERYDEWPAGAFPGWLYPVTFYRSIAEKPW
jgi:SAM-dependent methyltransferase